MHINTVLLDNSIRFFIPEIPHFVTPSVTAFGMTGYFLSKGKERWFSSGEPPLFSLSLLKSPIIPSVSEESHD